MMTFTVTIEADATAEELQEAIYEALSSLELPNGDTLYLSPHQYSVRYTPPERNWLDDALNSGDGIYRP